MPLLILMRYLFSHSPKGCNMCGRFTLTAPTTLICDYFGIDHITQLTPRYNIAPTQNVLVIREDQDGQREATQMRWGLVPFWMKKDKISSSLINARVESAFEKASFRAAFKKRRCLIVSDGFYEWTAVDQSNKKQPYHITRPNNELFAFAGLWERALGYDEEDTIESCTILTRDANKQMQQIHHRMPIILAPDKYDQWIHSNEDTPTLQEFITHVNNPNLTLTAVNTIVNNPRFDGPECVEQI